MILTEYHSPHKGVAALTKRASCHSFRHVFAMSLLEKGYDIQAIQEFLGHKDVKTTMIYTHVLNRGGKGGQKPGRRPERAVCYLETIYNSWWSAKFL